MKEHRKAGHCSRMGAGEEGQIQVHQAWGVGRCPWSASCGGLCLHSESAISRDLLAEVLLALS